MKFKDYIAEHELAYSTVAEAIDVSVETVRRYCNGDRIPQPEKMQKILEFTAGTVAPNDFYTQQNKAP